MAPAAGLAVEGTNETSGAAQQQYSTTTAVQKLCSGFGQYHSPDAKKNPKPLTTITLAEIQDLTAEPLSVAKDQAQWIIPSTLLSRSHAEQHRDGEFWALWSDFDEPQGLTFAIIVERARAAIPGAFMAYASRSANEQRQKARLIVPLADAVSGGEWLALQKILNDKVEEQGVTPDRVTERAGQLCYLPNRGDFYDHHIEGDPLGEPFDAAQWDDELAEEMERQEREEQERKARQKPERDFSQAVTVPEGGVVPSEFIRTHYNVREMLEAQGAVFVSETRFYAPGRTRDGNAGGVYEPENNRFYIHHHNDPFHDGYWHSPIDLLMAQYGLDWNDPESFVALCREVEIEPGVTIELHNRRAYMAAQDSEPVDVSALTEEPEEDAAEQPSPSGVDLMQPPGLAGEICKYISLKARRPRPELYPFAALHLMALVGKHRQSVYTSKLNLMTLAIATTAAGKEAPQSATKSLAHDAYCSGLIHGDSGSFKDLVYNLLEGDGSSLYIVDEVHSFLDSMKSKNAQTYETKMEAEILKMNTTELYTFRGMEKRQLRNLIDQDIKNLEKKAEGMEEGSEDADKIQRALERNRKRLDWLDNGLPNPFFSLMGHSVPQNLDQFIQPDNIASGLLGRTLVMRCPETRAKLRRTPVDEQALTFAEFNIENGLTNIRRNRNTIDVDEDAADYMDACIDWYDEDEQLNHYLVGGIYARAPEHLMRVASILALDAGTIRLEHVHYAHALVRQSIEDIKHILLKAYAESQGAQEENVMEHARQVIHRHCKGQGQPMSRIKTIVTKPKGWQEMQKRDVKRDRFQELIDRMLDSGELEKVKDGKRERYLSRAEV
ncbi:hypothetical protein [Salicola sp. Rm-C-2C1-2]|uniref:hypothetical protein n=1 Tax=Salicola sp. Rm-C-2C1-2 TaxID=3141321 RepID=UPI0032E4F454